MTSVREDNTDLSFSNVELSQAKLQAAPSMMVLRELNPPEPPTAEPTQRKSDHDAGATPAPEQVASIARDSEYTDGSVHCERDWDWLTETDFDTVSLDRLLGLRRPGKPDLVGRIVASYVAEAPKLMDQMRDAEGSYANLAKKLNEYRSKTLQPAD